MQRASVARLFATAALLWSGASAFSPLDASAAVPSAGPAYQTVTLTPVPFRLPAPPGTTAHDHDTGAGESSRIPSAAPGVMGTLHQIPSEFLQGP